MLSIEEIKKACEFADGFEYRGLTELYFFAHNYKMSSGTFKNVIYPLFLQRVIEGINKDGLANIDILTESIECQKGMDNNNFRYENNIDQAKEQAIKYILDKI